MSALDTFLSTAGQQIGDPYVFGTEGPDTFDCSGLVLYSLGAAGVSAPRTAAEQQRWATPTRSPLPGDLVFYGAPAHHVGIYLGGGKMIDAPHDGARVRIEGVGTPTSYGRVPGLSTAASAVAGAITPASWGLPDVTGILSGAKGIVYEVAFLGLGLALVLAGLWVGTSEIRHNAPNPVKKGQELLS